MSWKKKKTYGSYKRVNCPFCERQATQKNAQGIEVCYKHTQEMIEEIKCTCGSWLEARAGKFGRYFNCINCGNMNYEKAMEVKAITAKKTAPTPLVQATSLEKNTSFASPTSSYNAPERKKEITITSDDVEYFD